MHPGYERILTGGLSVALARIFFQELVNFGNELGEIDRFCLEIITANFQALVAIFNQSVGRQGDDGDMLDAVNLPDFSGGFPAIHNRQADVHQNQVW